MHGIMGCHRCRIHLTAVLLLALMVPAARSDNPVSAAHGTSPAKVGDSASTRAIADTTPDSFPELRLHRTARPLSPNAVTQDWPSFLGPMRNGRSSETNLRKQWPSGGPPLVWEVVKGSGYAAPAVSGGRLVFFHRLGDEEVVECLQADTGKRFWQHRYPTSYADRYGFGNGPRATPVIDGDRVYTHGAQGRLLCLDLATGKPRWSLDTSTEYGVPQGFFGLASTPLIEGDLLIVNVGAPEGPCVVAFDKRTGTERWRAGDKWGAAYASPIAADIHGQRRVFVFAGGDSRPPTGGLLSVNPINGAIDWRFAFRSTRYESVNASTPVVVGNRLFLSTSYDTGSVLLDIANDGTRSVAWKTDDVGLHFMTPIQHEGYLYAIDGSGQGDASVVCVDLTTGKVAWREAPSWVEQIERNGKSQSMTLGIYRGSMIHVDGHFLCLGEMGHLLWLNLSPQGYRQVARAWPFAAQESWTPPVLSRGLLYVMQNQPGMLDKTTPRLLCLDLRG